MPPDDNTLAKASELSSRLVDAIDATAGDLDRMPFFVRPMVKRGFAKRTGRSLAQWRELATLLRHVTLSSPDVGDALLALRGHPGLLADLEVLADDYRQAPERARRAMKGDALARATERSVERERIVRELIDTLGALGVG